MEKNQEIFKDYKEKIKNKLYISENVSEVSEDINNLINLLNYCFRNKNNFFVTDFNKKNIFSVVTCYNQIKTNILSKEVFNNINEIFNKIENKDLKVLKFILYNYINNFDNIKNNTKDDNTYLCQTISKDSIGNNIKYINLLISSL